MGPFPMVARNAQPWAVVRNPVGILRQMQGKPTREYLALPTLWVMSSAKVLGYYRAAPPGRGQQDPRVAVIAQESRVADDSTA